jgi:hypothetical protein
MNRAATGYDEWIGAWRTLALSAAVAVFSWPPLSLLRRGELPSYALVTVVFALLLAAIVILWKRTGGAAKAAPFNDRDNGRRSARARHQPIAIVTIAAAIVLIYSDERWVAAMVANPHGPDMLIVIREAVRRFLSGHDPYFTYRTYDAPWNMVLPYGPMLWGPYIVPVLLHTDLRVVTIAGELFVPLCCGMTAVVEAGRGRIVSAAAWILLLVAIVASIDLVNFTVFGHTPVYWPLLPVFAVVTTRRRWLAAALALGLLILARSTMVALVPGFMMAVWADARRRMPAAGAVLAGTVLAGLLPFMLWDFHAMWDGMVASYPRIMKQVVWTSNDGWAINTIGVTGWLLSHHREHLVEVTQAIVMAITCSAAWFAIRRGARPLPWMALALLAFSMTTLWPVNYIYFDVLLLFVSAAMAETLGRSGLTLRLTPWLATLAVVIVAVAVTLRLTTSRMPSIAVASPAAQPLLKQGFSRGERDPQYDFAWITGDRAVIAVPRSSAAAADLLIVCRQSGDVPQPQLLTANLNGRILGMAKVGPGWDTLRFAVPKSAWWIGFNRLELQLSPAGAARRLAVSRVDVVPRLP